MISHPDPETVLGELGDKVTAAISEAVRFAELEAGYEWNKDTRTVGAAVISLRDGRDNIIWVHPLPAPEAKDDKVTRPMVPGPTSPTVGIQGVATDEQAGSDQT